METFLIAGLGNPGKSYAGHRHNIGFMVADALSKRWGRTFNQKRSKADFNDGTFAGQRVIIAKPQTYMNLSGTSIGPIAEYFKVKPDHILAICDDLDIPTATIRLRAGGGSGGHNGLKSLAANLRTQDYPRLRIGIGRPPLEAELGRNGELVTAHVLSSFTPEERGRIIESIDQAILIVERWITDGIDATMNEANQGG